MSGEAVLELKNVRRQYGAVAAVDGLSLTIMPGEVFTLLGPSGCGKSTTLRMVAGLEQPDGGEVYLDGRLIASGDQGFSLA
ncbi:MAG TPA: ATP-binding cassette domain-containing protein, partial [Chloroflexota bacterium]